MSKRIGILILRLLQCVAGVGFLAGDYFFVVLLFFGIKDFSHIRQFPEKSTAYFVNLISWGVVTAMSGLFLKWTHCRAYAKNQ